MSGQVTQRDGEDAGTPVGVVGEHPAVVAAVEAAGGDPLTGTASEVVAADPEVVVAVGEEGLVSLVGSGVGAPILPVEAGRGVRSVPGMAVEPAVEHLVDGAHETVEHPVLVADSSRGETAALFDLMLVTGEPARISEYTVRTGGEEVGRFRADGVVVSTPAGSVGYNDAAGGPVLAPGTGVVAVVPVAPFATDQDVWVLPDDDVEVVVERDETPVELLADGESAGSVVAGEGLLVRTRGSLPVAVVEESYGFYARD